MLIINMCYRCSCWLYIDKATMKVVMDPTVKVFQDDNDNT
jgi:hypothetical protein